MPHALTLATMSVIAAVGAGLGTWMGHATVSEIDPVHFRAETRAAPMRVALTAPRPPVGAPVVEYASGLGRGCIKCRTYPEEYYPQPAPEIAAMWDEPSFQDVPPPSEEPAVDRSLSLAPYAYYPIEAGDVETGEPLAPVD